MRSGGERQRQRGGEEAQRDNCAALTLGGRRKSTKDMDKESFQD